jgi:hypothetical protein
MAKFELRPVVGLLSDNGRVRRVQWSDVELLMMDGRQIATISTRPGKAIQLMTHVPLMSNSQIAELSEFVAKNRLGVHPEWIRHPRPISGEFLDEEDSEGEDTEDESNDE